MASKRWKGLLRMVVREPLLHFALLGALLFALDAAVGAGEDEAHAAASPTAPSRVIALDDAQLEPLRAAFRRSWKRDPSADELADLIEEAIADEILFREGSALGLERDDAVVRQRVIEKMRALARPTETAPPTRAELEAWFAAYPHRFRQAPKVAFEQIYFDGKRRAARGEDVQAAVGAALARVRDPNAVGAVTGDDFVLSRRWEATPEPQIVNVFGEPFAKRLMTVTIGEWTGPLESQYGLHLVRVSERLAARMPSFEEAETNVRADLIMTRSRAVSEVERKFLPQYRVELRGAELQRLAKQGPLQLLLRSAR